MLLQGVKSWGWALPGLATPGVKPVACSCFVIGWCLAGITTGDSYALVVILETLTGFSLGAEGMALFARVAGGYLYQSS